MTDVDLLAWLCDQASQLDQRDYDRDPGHKLSSLEPHCFFLSIPVLGVRDGIVSRPTNHFNTDESESEHMSGIFLRQARQRSTFA